jgi:hypothetical protein
LLIPFTLGSVACARELLKLIECCTVPLSALSSVNC